MKQTLKQELDSIGEKGCIERLQYIANANLGARSEAAKRVIIKRNMREDFGRFPSSYYY